MLLVNDQRQELITEGVDVAFRFGSLGNSTAGVPRRPCAGLAASNAYWWHPAYLRRSGRPKVPADLSSHDIIAGPMAAP